jgi:hypothetical protein
MKSVLIGYFPKKTVQKPDFLKVENVENICSASTCISEGPEGYIDLWLQNECFLYDSVATAKAIPKKLNDQDEYDIYAFKKYPLRIENGESMDWDIPSVSPEPLSDNFEFLGYDAVSMNTGTEFECSPLSCNGGAETMKVNRFCLFETFEEALWGAKEFSKGNWEPGPYYIVEVYRLKK